MSGYYLDRVAQTTITTGTGDIALLAPATGHQSFAAFGDGVVAAYVIAHPTDGTWEVGLGTVHTAGPTLTRTTVLASTNSNALVNFAQGQKSVRNTLPAALAMGLNGSEWRSGTGVPSNSLGIDGDLYLRTTSGDLYQRASGTYSIIANIIGPIGPTGPAGGGGTNGANGIDSFTTTAANFVMPAISSTVTIAVGSTAWIGIGQELFVSDGTHSAYLKVSSITDTTHVVAMNDGTTGNATAGTTVTSGAKVSPGGKQGPSGSGSGTVVGPDPTTLDAVVVWDSVHGTAVRDSTVFLDRANNDKMLYNASVPRIETLTYAGGSTTSATLDLDLADEWILDSSLHGATINLVGYSVGQVVKIVILCNTGMTWSGVGTINWSKGSPPSLAAQWTTVTLLCTGLDYFGFPIWYEIARTTSDPAEVTDITATGSTISDAALLTDWTNFVSGANGTKGVRLPARPGVSTNIMRSIAIANLDPANLKVYPPSAGTINGGSTNAPLTFGAATCATLATPDGINFYSMPRVPA